MENVSDIFKNIITADKNVCQLYLNALDEHKPFSLKHREQVENIIQSISSLLAKRESRQLGLILFINFLNQCKNVELLERKGNIWITFILKALNTKSERESYGALIYSAIGKFAEKILGSLDLQKAFISTNLNKIYESLNLTLEEQRPDALNCVETCLCLYASSSALMRKKIDQYVISFIDSTDDQVTKCAGKCMHYLQQVRQSRETNCKVQWKNYQLSLLGSLHSTFNEIFSKCTEFYNESNQINNTLNVPALTLSNEPIIRAAQLFIRFHNLVSYLRIALREPFPVAKQILPKKIINLITRGLSMTCPTVMLNSIFDNLALSVLIPKIHYDLLCLLEDLIIVLGNHLKIYHEFILGLLADTLKWTSSKSIGIAKPLSKLRSKAYAVIKLWTSVLGNGSCCDTIAEFLLMEIISDISLNSTEFILKVSNTGKHTSKGQKIQNKQSSIARERKIVGEADLSDDSNQSLCIAALSCLNNVLLSSSAFIKPTILKVTHDKIMEICSCFYEHQFQQENLYFNWKCRSEIYRCLYIIISASNHLCPPPTQMTINILQKAQWRDSNIYVREKCTTLLFYLEKGIHAQKDSLLFPTEFCDIRNAFMKFGKESLLKASVFTKVSDECEDENFDQNTEAQILIKEKETIEHNIARNLPLNINLIEVNNGELGSLVASLKNNAEDGRTSLVDTIEENSISENQELRSILTDFNIKTNKDNLAAPLILKQKREEVPVTVNISTETSRKQESTQNVDEDVLMADIEAAFVDELN